MVWFAKSDAWVLIALAAGVGASAFVLYPLSSSHTQDLGGRENAVEVSTGLLLAYTIGAIVGPTTAAWMMSWIGPQALFIHNGTIHVLFVAFVVWRLWQRPERERSTSTSDREPTRPLGAFTTFGCARMAFGHGAHGDQFLGGGRVHRHGGVEVGLGRAHLDRDADHLDHLAGVRPDDMAADHAVGRAIDDELHQHARFAADERPSSSAGTSSCRCRPC